MTKLLEQALLEVRKLPPSEQDAAAVALLDYLSDMRSYQLTDEQRAEIHRRVTDPNPVLLSYDEVRKRLGLSGS